MAKKESKFSLFQKKTDKETESKPEPSVVPVQPLVAESASDSGLVVASDAASEIVSDSLDQEPTRVEVEVQAPKKGEKTDYQALLANYQPVRMAYEEERGNYETLLKQYEESKSLYEKTADHVKTIADELQTLKQDYDVAYASYNQLKARYDEEAEQYRTAKDRYDDIQLQSKEAERGYDVTRASYERIKAQLEQENQTKHELAKNDTAVRSELEEKQQLLKQLSSEVALLAPDREQLYLDYQTHLADYEAAKKAYQHAQQVKRTYEGLSQNYEKVSAAKSVAETNYQEAQQLLHKGKQKLATKSKVKGFLEQPVTSIDSSYQEELQQFTAIKAAYEQTKIQRDNEIETVKRLQSQSEALQKVADADNSQTISYLEEERNQASVKIIELNAKLKPLAAEYKEKRDSFTAVKKAYDAIKKVSDRAVDQYQTAKAQVDTISKAYEEVQEAHEALAQKDATIKADLEAATSNYQGLVDRLDQIQEQYEADKVRSAQSTEAYQNFQKVYEELQEAIETSQADLSTKQAEAEAVRKQFNESQAQLDITQDKLASSQKAYEEAKASYEKLSSEFATLETEVQSSQQAVNTTFQDGSSQYEVAAKQYEAINGLYDNYAQNHEGVLHYHDKVTTLYQQVYGKYEHIAESFKKVQKVDQAINKIYQEELSHYDAQKAHYDKVNYIYHQAQQQYQATIDAKKDFDEAAKIMHYVLVQDDALTFPIYEATSYNYIDEFNLPEIEQLPDGSWQLKDQMQFRVWQKSYLIAKENLQKANNTYASLLRQYQMQVDQFIQAGGQEVLALGNAKVAYQGADIMHYAQDIDSQVTSWQAEYRTREAAFAELMSVYQDYLRQVNALTQNLIQAPDNQEGLQETVNSINSLVDFNDMTSPDYRSVAALAQKLGVTEGELTRPRTTEDLSRLIKDNYHASTKMILSKYAGNFAGYLANIRANYEHSYKTMQDALAKFQAQTHISVADINIQNIMVDQPDFEQYFSNFLNENVTQLEAVMSGKASFVNLLKKAGHLPKASANFLENLVIDTDLSFPEKQVTLSEGLLETDTQVMALTMFAEPKPVKAPGSELKAPEIPIRLMDKPELVSPVIAPEKLVES